LHAPRVPLHCFLRSLRIGAPQGPAGSFAASFANPPKRNSVLPTSGASWLDDLLVAWPAQVLAGK